MDPQLLELCLNFYTATGSWLVELIRKREGGDGTDNNIFPIPEQVMYYS